MANQQQMQLKIFAVMECINDSDTEFSSSSSDESITDETCIALSLLKYKKKRQKRPRIENYVEVTVNLYTATEFKSHFRLWPSTFEFILNLIGPTIANTNYVSGRKPIAAKKQVLLTLWIMATPDTYRSVSERFNVGKATAFRGVRRVSRALYSLAPSFITWPTGERAIEVMRQFERYSGFPKTVGAVDGTHVRIRAPQEDAGSYINRKGYHSIQIQAVCTHDLLFTSVFSGNAGSVHDARVFRLSQIPRYMEESHVYFPDNSHLLGDAAYGIHPNLMVPFRNNGHLTPRQQNFNYCLSSGRMAIERAFGLWKVRWRSILDCLPMITLEKIPEFLVATCVLHNVCVMKGDLFPFEPILRVRRRGNFQIGRRLEGEAKRTQITNNLIILNH